jgi:hypothetical protein
LAKQEQMCRDRVVALAALVSKCNEYPAELDGLEQTIARAATTEKQLAEEIEQLKAELGAGTRVTLVDGPFPRRGR